MTDRELMQQALDALENNLQVMKDDWDQIDQEWGPSQGGLQAAIDGTLTGYEYFKDTISAITALRERLSQPEQSEPVAWISKHGHMQGNHENLSKRHADEYSASPDWTKLYTHPAPKAEPVNQQLLEALKKIATVNAMDYEYQAWARAAIAAAEQAPQTAELTDDEIDLLIADFVDNGGLLHEFARAVIAAQKEKAK